MKYFYNIIFSLILLFLVASQANSTDRLSPGLVEAISNFSHDSDSLVQVVIFLGNENVKEAVFKMAQNPFLKRDERIKSVIRQLKSYQAPYKENILRIINNYSVTPVIEHWIIPAVTATIPLSVLDTLSFMDGIKRVVENINLSYEPPVNISSASQSPTAVISNELNLLKIPELWKRGLKGKGRLVCSFDTGVEQSHPALASKWRGNHVSLASSWFSMVAADTLPYDKIGHGTHTMGVMVGALEADSFGVAPEAEWITAGVIDQGRSLSVTLSDIIQAFQWALNPDGNINSTDDVPDVILNSWGIPKGLFVPCDDTFWGVIDNVEAAGIVTIFAAGNEGPEAMTIRSPGNRAASPINSFTVGAVHNNKNIASFSSRGPSSCDINQIKPEVVGPGINIRSSYKGGGFFNLTGTSMAAPYYAGLVALIRQYNPDATVEDIKYAILQAAEDLGSPGEDNVYGNGLVDASQVLNYIPLPAQAIFEIAGYQISDDGIAFPGESFGLRLTINNPSANHEAVTGVLKAPDINGVTFVNDSAYFYFGIGGTTAINISPFEIVFNSSFYNGQIINFQLVLTSTFPPNVDTTNFSLIVGIEPGGTIALHRNDKLSFSVSDFGQYGFANGSIYNALGEGFRFDGSNNLLYEAGIILGRNELQLSTSIRNENGTFKSSDFSSVEPLSDIIIGSDGGSYRTTAFNDQYSEIPIPIDVYQETINYDNIDDDGFIIFKYILTNNSLERLSGLYFGFLSDFDLSGNDIISYDSTISMLHQKNQNGLEVGIVPLKNINTMKAAINDSSKTGFSNQELYDLISIQDSILYDSIAGDVMIITTAGPFNLDPETSVEIAFALIAGNNFYELNGYAQRARERFDLATGINDNMETNLPDNYRLSQNYPNPFNPTTTISFSVPANGKITIDILNILGQKVKTLFDGYLSVGNHQVDWNATNKNGEAVAGGLYFYRLSADNHTQTKKMLLLK